MLDILFDVNMLTGHGRNTAHSGMKLYMW